MNQKLSKNAPLQPLSKAELSQIDGGGNNFAYLHYLAWKTEGPPPPPIGIKPNY